MLNKLRSREDLSDDLVRHGSKGMGWDRLCKSMVVRSEQLGSNPS